MELSAYIACVGLFQSFLFTPDTAGCVCRYELLTFTSGGFAGLFSDRVTFRFPLIDSDLYAKTPFCSECLRNLSALSTTFTRSSQTVPLRKVCGHCSLSNVVPTSDGRVEPLGSARADVCVGNCEIYQLVNSSHSVCRSNVGLLTKTPRYYWCSPLLDLLVVPVHSSSVVYTIIHSVFHSFTSVFEQFLRAVICPIFVWVKQVLEDVLYEVFMFVMSLSDIAIDYHFGSIIVLSIVYYTYYPRYVSILFACLLCLCKLRV